MSYNIEGTRNPPYFGNLPLVNPEYRPLVNTAATAAALAVAAVVSPLEFAKIIGTTVLTGIGYGIANDMVACRDCIEYFTIGHFYDGTKLRNRPLNTLDPNLNAIAWGAIATWHVCAVAGTFFALLARMPFPRLALKITAAQIAPCFAIGSAITFLISHVNSRLAQKQMADHPYQKYQNVPTRLQAGWEACNTRNLTGYSALSVGGMIISTTIVAARVGLSIL